MADEEPRKKKQRGQRSKPSKARHSEERLDDTAWYMPAEDDILALSRPHHGEDSRRKWYLPDEGIHGASKPDAQPLQEDPSLLEEDLWYLPKSEKGSQQKESKSVKPKSQEFERFEQD